MVWRLYGLNIAGPRLLSLIWSNPRVFQTRRTFIHMDISQDLPDPKHVVDHETQKNASAVRGTRILIQSRTAPTFVLRCSRRLAACIFCSIYFRGLPSQDYRHTDFVELTAPLLTPAALPIVFNDCSLAFCFHQQLHALLLARLYDKLDCQRTPTFQSAESCQTGGVCGQAAATNCCKLQDTEQLSWQ